jgi:Flp pilus assembly protein TadD
VNYRLSYLAKRIADLSAATPPPAESRPAAPEPTTPAPITQKPQPAPPADWQDQIGGLKDQARQLQSDKALLEAKLKEALAMRPAESEPGALAKAEQKIQALQKENDLLKVSVEKPAPAALDVNALAQAQQSLSEANRQLAEQSARASKLSLEKEALESRLKSLSLDTSAATELRSQNQALKKQLSDLQAASPAAKPDSARPSTEAQQQIAMLQADKEALRLEKVALESRIKQLTSAGTANGTFTSAPAASESARIKQIEAERDDLQKRLDSATKEMYGRKGKAAAGRVQELENQLALVRARLEIFEARAVPYSAEELELLKRPQAKLAEVDPKSGKKSIKELPAGSAALVAEAQRCFAAKQYDKAEAAYLQVLQQDPKNVPTLANLAAIQVEEEHFDRAEANVKQALSADPEDAYSLYILGILRFRQGKYDEALEALGHSAKIDPQNAEVQNYLGLTLSEKGMRVPAEAALRKAIQLQPSYAGAHYNLAVVYATQQPPATELARWHYQKAIAAGHPHNADLEKKFESRK